MSTQVSRLRKLFGKKNGLFDILLNTKSVQIKHHKMHLGILIPLIGRQSNPFEGFRIIGAFFFLRKGLHSVYQVQA